MCAEPCRASAGRWLCSSRWRQIARCTIPPLHPCPGRSNMLQIYAASLPHPQQLILIPSSAAWHMRAACHAQAYATCASHSTRRHMRCMWHVPARGTYVASACAICHARAHATCACHMPHARATCSPSLHVQLHFQLQLNRSTKKLSHAKRTPGASMR
jgi:hypothetical protein